jgi:glutathione S-transferase
MFDHFGTFAFPASGLVTLVALGVYFMTILNIRRVRIKYRIMPPLVEGPEEFQRAFRTQMNTIEQLIIFFPSLWLAAVSIGDVLAAAIGLLWPLARLIYMRGYMAADKRRFKGFVAALAVSITLYVAAMIGMIASL